MCESYPEIPWSQLVRTRNRLIHGYFKVDSQLLFMMATVRVNIFHRQITNIILEIQKTPCSSED
ncbi:DUF86 domain-containing protein [Methanospirillum sp.]|uniref:HepT-like ribonuclease domain-containing protein n=1 Tax=Methanospirillum sp. TaxID=45200 RepID=UPI0039C8DE39